MSRMSASMNPSWTDKHEARNQQIVSFVLCGLALLTFVNLPFPGWRPG
jgi:hypothetical protein